MKYFTKYCKTNMITEEELQRLRRKYVVSINPEDKTVYVRRKDTFTPTYQPARSTKWEKFETVCKLLSILSVLTIWNFWFTRIYLQYPEVQAKTTIDKIEQKINLSPVTFTKEELEMIKVKGEFMRKENWTVEDHIRDVFGTSSNWAIKCFKSESGLRVNAVGINKNKSHDIGVAQINTPLHCPKVEKLLGKKLTTAECRSELKNPVTNLKVAYQIFKRSGSKPWYGKGCN
jgi:hypothetical protein